MGSWGGDYCGYNDGVEVGILAFVRRLLEALHTAMQWVADRYNELPDYEFWLRLPTGHEIKIVNASGVIVPNFYTLIPNDKFRAVEYTVLGVPIVRHLPKKKYLTVLSAVLAPVDYYIPITSEDVRMDDASTPSWGLLSDTVGFAQAAAMIGFVFKWLKDLGFFRTALKWLQTIMNWVKKRMMKDMIHDIEDMCEETLELLKEDVDPEVDELGEVITDIRDRFRMRTLF